MYTYTIFINVTTFKFIFKLKQRVAIYYSVMRRVPNIYRSVAKLIAIIIYAKTFNFKVVYSRIGVGNIKECVNL